MNLKICFSSLAMGLVVVLLEKPVPAATKPVMVHYMPWFTAKPFSSKWGYHWTMNNTNYNPEEFYPNGCRKIASHYYPLIGPYDSLDPAVLEYHVLLMKLGGIDGIIADWYGQENYLDYGAINQRTSAVADWARRAGLTFAICYEDRTVQVKVNNGYISAANALGNAQQSMLFLQANYFSAPNYLQIGNRPVLLNFGPVYFKANSQWASIFSALTNPPAFFTEDNRYPAGMGAFNWPPMWLSAGGVLSANSLNSYLNNFETSGSAWPAYISGAFPRFHDFYAQAGLASYGYLDDRNGCTLRETLSRALTNKSDIVQIITWNDFSEGTIVEPTVEHGYRDLGLIQDCRRQYLDSSFCHNTNDLNLVFRLYLQRRLLTNDPIVAAEMNRIFTNLISGQLCAANTQLTGLETKRPVLYGLTLNSNQFQFMAGGYLGADSSVMASSDLVSWQTLKTYSVKTNLITFATNINTQAGNKYYMLKSSQ